MVRKDAMCPFLRLLLILWMCSHVHGGESPKVEKEQGVEAIGKFVEDIIKTWHLLSPTIVVEDNLPDLCMTNGWWLCLTNDMDADDLAIHLTLIHNKTKQDAMILVGNLGHRQLLNRLNNLAPSMFRSNVPVFMAEEYMGQIQLRLDSNIIFYKKLTPTKFKFFDKFRLSYGRWINPKQVKNQQKKGERNKWKTQIARLRSLDLGDWNMSSGIILQKSLNRWDRRIDLKGAGLLRNCMRYRGIWADWRWDKSKNHPGHVCYKCINNNQCYWKSGKMMQKDNCRISVGYFQEMLHYITDSLNLELSLVMDHGEQNWVWRQENFGLPKKQNYTGQKGYLKIRAADVVSDGLGASGPQGIYLTEVHGLSMAIPTNRASPTLIAAIPKASHIQFWAYVRVFGVTQWVLFILLLVGFVIVQTMITSAMNMDVTDGSILNMILSSISSAYLFTLQLGAHKTGKHSRIITLLTLTLSMLTMLFWVYYCCDITANMTTGPIPPIPVKNFDDVLEYGYKVRANTYFSSFLESSKNGSASQKVYSKYFHNKLNVCGTQCPIGWMLERMYEDPKTLWYDAVSVLLNDKRVSNEIYNGLTLLKLDDNKIHTHAALMLQHDSEFLQIFNHHIMKMIETGVLKRIYRKYFNRLYVNEPIGMPEPHPLGINNVLFLFILLGTGISMALGIAFVEYIVAKWHQMRVVRPKRLQHGITVGNRLNRTFLK